MIKVTHKGDWSNTERFLNTIFRRHYLNVLEKYGREGVNALQLATPVDTGKTASSWDYRIKYGDGTVEIEWINTNISNGVNIAIILRYGHGTRNGGYVRGRDYITPAMQPIFDRMADDIFKEVTSL